MTDGVHLHSPEGQPASSGSWNTVVCDKLCQVTSKRTFQNNDNDDNNKNQVRICGIGRGFQNDDQIFAFKSRGAQRLAHSCLLREQLGYLFIYFSRGLNTRLDRHKGSTASDIKVLITNQREALLSSLLSPTLSGGTSVPRAVKQALFLS